MARKDQLETIRLMGQRARQDGEPKSACPYPDKRTARGSVTFSRAFRNAWFEGWREANEESTQEARGD